MNKRDLKALGAVLVILTISAMIGTVIGISAAWVHTQFGDSSQTFRTLATMYSITGSVGATISFFTAVLSEW